MASNRVSVPIEHRQTRKDFGRIESHKTTLIEYPHAGYTLEFEQDPTRYINDLREWTEETAGSSATSHF